MLGLVIEMSNNLFLAHTDNLQYSIQFHATTVS